MRSDLPPGCALGSIPGVVDSPEDAVWDELCEIFPFLVGDDGQLSLEQLGLVRSVVRHLIERAATGEEDLVPLRDDEQLEVIVREIVRRDVRDLVSTRLRRSGIHRADDLSLTESVAIILEECCWALAPTLASAVARRESPRTPIKFSFAGVEIEAERFEITSGSGNPLVEIVDWSARDILRARRVGEDLAMSAERFEIASGPVAPIAEPSDLESMRLDLAHREAMRRRLAATDEVVAFVDDPHDPRLAGPTLAEAMYVANVSCPCHYAIEGRHCRHYRGPETECCHCDAEISAVALELAAREGFFRGTREHRLRSAALDAALRRQAVTDPDLLSALWSADLATIGEIVGWSAVR